MKKATAALAMTGLLLGLAAAGEITQTLRFNRDQVSLGTEYGYTTVDFAGAPAVDRLGVPALPELPMHLVVPPTAIVTGVEVRSVIEEALPGEYLVLPGQIGRQWRPDDPVPPFVEPNPEVYNSNEAFPKEIVEHQVTGNKGGYRVAGFTLHPVRYVPATRKLFVVTRAEVVVRYQEGSVPEERRFARQNQLLGGDLQTMVMNPQDIRRFAPGERHSGEFSQFLPPGYFEHVIVSPQEYADSFVALRDWRTLQGMPSTIMTMEAVCGTYPGRDTAEKIRNFIKDAVQTWGTIWVFLPRRDVPALEYRKAYVSYSGTDQLPCDLYFSDLDGSWDGDRDGIYGECPADSITGYSDVYVGFIPIDNPGDITTFMQKLMRYETNPGANYVRKTCLPVGVSFSQNYSDSIANATPTGWSDFKMYYPNGSKAIFLDSIRAGFGYSAGIHHGSVNALYHGSPELIHSNDAIALNNQKLGVIISVGCDPGAWDHAGTVNGDCLAENMCTKAQNGWVAIMMNARSGWIAVAEFYNYQFMYKILPPGPPACSGYVTVGQGLGRAKDHWIPRWNLNGDSSRFRWEAYERNLFGEPAMQLWTDEPATCVAQHTGVVTIGSSIPYNVTVTDGSDAPIEGAQVLCWKGSEVYAKARTNSSGLATVYVSPTTPGPMVLTVNATNHFLLIDTVQVISTARYVSYLRSTIRDPLPGGNGDSILNPGESVKIPTWVKNWGQASASGVSAKLRTHDPNAQVTDSMKTFGTIAAGDSAFTGDNGFGLQAATGLSNGYGIACSLLCRDALDSVWVSNIVFTVGTPVLTKQQVTVRDSVHGNNNGKIDPGETSELELVIRNTGGGHGYNCRALLRSGDARFTIEDSTSTYGSIPRGTSASNIGQMFRVTAGSSIPMETPIPCSLYYFADGGYTGAEAFTVVVGEIRAVDPIPDGPRQPPLYYAYDDVDANYPPHPTYNWIELRGRGTRLTLSDDQTVQIDIPTSFGPLRYYGQNYTQLSICGNGWVAPGYVTSTAYNNAAIPTTTLPAAAIAVCWDDIYPPVGGGVWWMYDTAAHALVVEWDSVAYYSNRTTCDKYEIVIFDSSMHALTTDNVIVLQYASARNYTSSSVGMQDQSMATGIGCLFNGAYHRGCAPLAPNRAIKFSTDGPTAIAEDRGAAAAIAGSRFLAYPNPLHGLGHVAWTVPTEGRVTLRVYDASGRVVRNLVETSMKPGRYTTAWNGKDNSGSEVASGIYFYQLETTSSADRLKVIVAR